MSFLSQATKPTNKPPMITLVGSPGSGKTTLGASFPSPIFIQAEDGAAVFESWNDDNKPTLMPALLKANKAKNVSTKNTLMAQIRELATAEHDFKTLVIDSITSLNVMLEDEIAQRDNVGNVADASGGFHKGYLEVAQWHSDVLNACDILRKLKGMTIVFLAHTGVEKIKNSPSESSEYAVYGLDMHKKSASLYVAQCDAVLYIKKEEFIIGGVTDKKTDTTKGGRAMQTGDRKIITSGDGLVGYVSAKNRYNMPLELDLLDRQNPILQHIKFFN